MRCPSRRSPCSRAPPRAPACPLPSPATCATPRPAPCSPPPSRASRFAGDYGGTWFLTRLVGSGKARELYYFSERLSAEDAATLGIVNAVFSPADLEAETLRLANRLADGPRVAYRYMKENLNRAVHGELGECLDMEAAHHIHTGPTHDHREAAKAFVEKREPKFRGR